MFVKRQRGWELPEHAATSEAAFLNRRQLLAAAGGGLLLGAGGLRAKAEEAVDPTADLYPAKRNELYTIERPVTPEAINSTYNNFYEFGSHKRIYQRAQALNIRPWEVRIDGEVENPFTIEFDDLIRKVSVEERLYRHRCVEAWSMTVPWSGFPLKDLVALAKPLSKAKYLRMETFHNPDVATGQKQSWYPWPYVEGVTIEEATNDLAFLVTGAYGKPLHKQFGAPLRLALPWKYGFKSIKSIVRFSFTEERPVSFWEQIQKNEYGFWANVNPEVSHPRWSQARETVLESGEKIPTQLFNGYGEYVAHLYDGLEDKEPLYM
ncbi:protein-methionine-sulfoxide reductase catalytic subunit MsrP [Coralliovum pocilloporae]|uniref:protein-methionine-sulfoxide reductase catalytic subunit MsrP n=1 Tax=Coralliovum pocilloporae TaxID=3066369 RepID=UPI003306B946